MPSRMLLALAVLAILGVAEASAPPPADPPKTVQPMPFFVYNHYALTRTRLDPLINPGKLSPHTHIFSGANRVTANASFVTLSTAECTTAPISIDKSLYWAPQLYYKDEQGKYTAMSGDGIVTYWFYHRGQGDPETFPELPDDFRMLAGDMNRDSIDMTKPSHQAVSFQCFGPGYDKRLPYIPADFECETIRPQVGFPNCWDGVNAYKDDNSHVVYGEGNYETGKCPEGFKRIPTLFLETYYRPSRMLSGKYKWRPGSLVFSNGDNFGLSFHADWINGFPRGALNTAYDQCKTTFNGTAASCPYLAQYLQTDKQRDCTVEGEIVNEPVGLQRPLDWLPGGHAEYNSSAVATQNQPKGGTDTYTERGVIVPVKAENGGVCKTQRCTDYRVLPDAGKPGDGNGKGTGGDYGPPPQSGPETTRIKTVGGSPISKITQAQEGSSVVKTVTQVFTRTVTITQIPQTNLPTCLEASGTARESGSGQVGEGAAPM